MTTGQEKKIVEKINTKDLLILLFSDSIIIAMNL